MTSKTSNLNQNLKKRNNWSRKLPKNRMRRNKRKKRCKKLKLLLRITLSLKKINKRSLTRNRLLRLSRLRLMLIMDKAIKILALLLTTKVLLLLSLLK